MKTLELNQMENLQGGELNTTDCLLIGMGLVALSLLGAWEGVIGLAVFSGDCYSN